ncbi:MULTISPECIES: hypothetical protein [Microcystis]|uniref:hypothetical protein n=1 Tax=Microcystis TaxID=1125 RepID=UPI0005C6C20A|nr:MULTISPECIES: hypothetical protein [Microcystis]
MFNERIVPIVGLKWGTRLALSQLALSQVEGVEGLALSQVEGVARFSSGISPTIGVGLIHELALQSALSNGKMLRISTGALHLSSSDLTTPFYLFISTGTVGKNSASIQLEVTAREKMGKITIDK